jgi:hypothetical protein
MHLGEPDEVVSRYLATLAQRRDPYAAQALPCNADCSPQSDSTLSDLVVYSIPNIDHRWGNRDAEILGIQLLDESGRIVESINHGEQLTVRLSVKFNEALPRPNFGVVMRNRLGEDVSGINTSAEGIVLPPTRATQVYTLDFHLQLPLLHPGYYYFSAAVANGSHEEYVICDWVENATMLLVRQRTLVYGYMKFDCRIELKYVSPIVTDWETVQKRS